MNYWDYLDHLVSTHEIVLDRPKGSAHPRYPDFIYPLDYGYLKDTTTVDGGGIDIFVGSKVRKAVEGIICTVDLNKKDAEIKIMFGCLQKEIETALKISNYQDMRGIFIKRP